jgi:hypothetical protein
MRRLLAAKGCEHGLQIMPLPALGARLAGGFIRVAQEADVEPAIQSAVDAGGFAELEAISELPGTRRALARTLSRAWNADIDLGSLREQSPRLSDLALIEKRVLSSLPMGVLTPRQLRDRALTRTNLRLQCLGQSSLRA